MVQTLFHASRPTSDCPAHIDRILLEAMARLFVNRAHHSFCVITNAGYVKVNGSTTESWIDAISDVTGRTIGSGNLLFYHRSIAEPLQIAFFEKQTGRCVVVGYDGSTERLSQTVAVGFERLGGEWVWSGIQSMLGPDAGTIVTFGHQWTAGAPHDFMKCAEFHNHLCPGIVSGYFIANFIRTRLMGIGHDSCSFIACPQLCWADAIQVVLNQTAGTGLVLKKLPQDHPALQQPIPAAGIAVITSAGGDRRIAYIIGYDWNTAAELAGCRQYSGFQGRLKQMTGLVPHFGRPELLVQVLKELRVTPEQAAELTTVSDPYEMLGFPEKGGV